MLMSFVMLASLGEVQTPMSFYMRINFMKLMFESWFTQRVFHPSSEQFYSSTKYTKLHNLDPPIVFKQIKKELLVGIDLHYYGNPHGLHPGRDHFVEGEQILINYDWRNPRAV